MALIDMYTSTPTVDVSNTLANLRKEESARKEKNWEASKGLLKDAAVGSIRSQYSDQIEWDKGVSHADKVFKVQYERLMAVDPQAAEQLASEYSAERNKRVAREVSDAYQGGSSSVSEEMKALEQEILALEADIKSEEARIADEETRKAEEEARRQEQLIKNSTAQKDATRQMQGYRPTPEPSGFRSFYGLGDPQASAQSEAASDMQGYRPLTAFYGAR